MIPPLSVIRVKRVDPDWDNKVQVGDTFRIGYYSEQDGSDCVWLVNSSVEYQETWDQVSLFDWFEVIELSNETDFYGVDRPRLEAISQ